MRPFQFIRCAFESPCLFAAALLVLASHAALFAQGDATELRGELPVRLKGQLVGAAMAPSISEIESMLDHQEPKTVAVLRLHSDQNNHYAPSWSVNGRAIAFLRSDLDRGTRKVIVRQIDSSRLRRTDELTRTLYSGQTSFEDLAMWSVGNRSVLVFDSTNEPSGGHNVHRITVDESPTKITEGTGVVDFPAAHADSQGSFVIFRRDRELRLATFRPGATEPVSTDSLGEGEEAQPAHHGRYLAVVRRSDSGDAYHLVLRERGGVREKNIHSTSAGIIRNPRFSPDGQWIAFHSRPQSENHWSLWAVPIDGSRRPEKLAGRVRVQEDFRHVGPAWSPNSTGIWHFGHSTAQAHYPLQFAGVQDNKQFSLDYPVEITSGSEPSISPVARRPVILFAGHTSRPRDIFALVMSRSP